MLIRLVSLDAIATDPREVLKLPPSDVREALLKCAGLLASLGSISTTGETTKDRWLKVKEASEITGMSVRWLYQNYRKYNPPLGEKRGQKTLRFSENRLKRWLQSKAA